MTSKQKATYTALRVLLHSEEFQIGTKLPTFKELAGRLQTSVKLLERVMPLFALEGCVEIVPHVGTYLRRRPVGEGLPNLLLLHSSSHPLPVSLASQTRIKVFDYQYTEFTFTYWRQVMQAFEDEFPHIRVELTRLADADSTVLAGADVCIMSLAEARVVARDTELLSLIDVELRQRSHQYLGPARALLSSGVEQRFLPLAVGASTLYVNTPRLDAFGLNQPECWSTFPALLDTCKFVEHSAGMAAPEYGCVISSFDGPLYGMGLLSKSGLRLPEVEAYLIALATLDRRTLVTPADVDPSELDTHWMIKLLASSNALFALSTSWMNPWFAPETWTAVVPPLGQHDLCPMSMEIAFIPARTKQPEAACVFTRFLSGLQAQKIISDMGAYLPVLSDAGVTHPLSPLYHQRATSGWIEIGSERIDVFEQIKRICWDVRVHRISVADALRRFQAMDTRGTASYAGACAPRAASIRDVAVPK